jgi:hypothetical protein
MQVTCGYLSRSDFTGRVNLGFMSRLTLMELALGYSLCLEAE